jgi:hypothetical protein
VKPKDEARRIAANVAEIGSSGFPPTVIVQQWSMATSAQLIPAGGKDGHAYKNAANAA